jgi:WD40 repeat protein/DNA-binding SARP family transcriptional activator
VVLELRLLGQFEVRLDETPILLPSRHAQSLLAFLVLSAGTAHRRERLAALLWPDTDDDNARAYLRHALWRIRKALEATLPDNRQYLLSDDLTIAFNKGSACWVDAVDLEAAATDGATTDALLTRLGLYRGELLPGFTDDWVVRERARIEAVFERQMDRLLEMLVSSGRWADVLQCAERWIALGHAPEPAFRALMLAHNERGDRSRVSAIYRRCREALFEELGAQPSEQTRILFERLSRGERVVRLSATPSPDGQPPGSAEQEPPAPGEAPFLGLKYFEETDTVRFFGRERLVDRLVQRLQTERFLALIGASGSGKSSVLRAGLVPRLRQAQGVGGGEQSVRSPAWTVIVLTPTARPLEALSASVAGRGASTSRRDLIRDALARDPRGLRLQLRHMASPAGRVLLVVDQLEELFTLCHDSFEQEAFVDNLLAVACEPDGRESLLLALRADFYAHCAQFAELREMLSQHQEYVGAMAPEELRRAIEGPAERGNWKPEHGLVDLVLRDAGDEPGALPLLSHALLETWRRRRGRRLTFSGYAEAGGVRGAISQSAEFTLRDQLTTSQQAIARRVFLRLTELGDGTQDTRRRATFEELVTGPDDAPVILEVLHVLAAARLVTLDEGTAEVAHEALIREWPTLRTWLDEDRTALRLHRSLAAAARDWESHGNDSDLLFRGARLMQLGEWADTHSDDLNPSERSFLDASVALTERQNSDREAQRRREFEAAQQLASAEQRRAEEQSRATARLRRRAIGLASALVLALGMTGAALFFADQARQGTTLSQANARIASARELAAAAVSSLDADPERGILLAQQAVLTTYRVDGTWTTEAENALHRAVLASRVRRTLNEHTGAASAVAISPDGAHLVSAGEDGNIRLTDLATGKNLWTTSGQAGLANAVAFSPDGQRLAATGAADSVQILDTRTGGPLLMLHGNSGPATSIAFSPDGARLATAGRDGAIQLWDAVSGSDLRTVFGSDVRDLGFSPDGSRLYTVEDGGTISIWSGIDASAVLPLLSLRIDGEGLSAAFSPNGLRIASVDGTDVRVWDAETGKELQRFTASNTNLTRIAYSPDGTRFAVGGLDRRVTVWDTGTGGQVLRGAGFAASPRLLIDLAGHMASIRALAFAPDGSQLATAAEDGTSRIWDLGAAHELLALPNPDWSGPFESQAPPLSLGRVFYDPAGIRLAVSLQDGRVQLLDAGTARQIRQFSSGESEKAGVAAAFSADGTLLAIGGSEGVIDLVDSRFGTQVRSMAAHHGPILGVAFSSDGKHLASAGEDGAAKIWNLVDPSRPPLGLLGDSASVTHVAFSPDGRHLAASSVDGTVRVWDVETGAQNLIIHPASQQAAPDTAADSIALQPLRAMSQLATQPEAVWSVAYSPDGSRLVTAGRADGGTATIWDAISGQQILVLRGHLGTVVQAAFSQDGRLVATASRDGTAKVWNSTTGANLLTLYGDNTGLGGVDFSPDGTHLAASADDATRVYVLQMEDLLALARARLTRTWTADECNAFLHLQVCPT